MGWAGSVAKLLLAWMVLRNTYTVLLTPDQRDATVRVLRTNGLALLALARQGRRRPAHWEPDGGPMADALSLAFSAVLG